MPRKKLTTTSPSDTPATEPIAPATNIESPATEPDQVVKAAPRRSAKKAAPAPTGSEIPVSEAPKAAASKRGTRTAKVAEPAPEPVAAPAEEASVVAVPAAAEPPIKRALFGRIRPATVPAVTTAEETGVDVATPIEAAAEAPSVESISASASEPESPPTEKGSSDRRSRGRSRKGSAEQEAPKAVVEAPLEPEAEPEARVETPEEFGDLTVLFRSRSATPAPSSSPAKPVEQAEADRREGRDRGRNRGRGRDREAVSAAREEAVAAPVSAPVKPVAPEIPDYSGEPAEIVGDNDLIILAWRPKSAQPGIEFDGGADGGEDGVRRRRRRRGRGRGEIELSDSQDQSQDSEDDGYADDSEESVVAAKPVARAPQKPEPLPQLPEKAAIPVPERAPQVVLRQGVPMLVRDGRVYPPILFFSNPADARRTANSMEQLAMAAEAGVHVASFLLQLEVSLDAVEGAAKAAAHVLDEALKTDPEVQVLFRIHFTVPRDWEAKYPNAKFRNAQGQTAEPSVCDDQFWGVAQEALERLIRELGKLERRDHILGVQLDRGEWFLSPGSGYDTSRAATHKFRDWARRRYLNDIVTLRASWFDGSVRFDSIEVPEYSPEGGDGEKFIRSSRKQRKFVDYHLFLSDATVARIVDLAYAVKEASEGWFLVGVSYGYTFEWSHADSGHLALGKLLRAEEIDFIGGPPSYRNREPGGSAPFPGPIDSFALNGKLYLSEEDFKTSLSTGHEPDDFNVLIKTPQALESVHWRGAGAALAHGSGISWMDLWGNGWLKTHSVWERAGKLRDALVRRTASPMADPDVAVFIDERALAYLVDTNAFALLVQNVRESVLRAGVSAGFYLLSDLQHREKFPESKLYLFLNAWDIRPDLRAAIKSRLQRDDKVLVWLYSAGLFDAGRDSLERAREVTGIALKPQPFYSKAGTTILNRRHPLSEAFPDRSVIGGTKLEPSYFAIPEGGVVLGEYTQTGLPSFVVKESTDDPNARWTSVFLGEPLVNPALIRALAQLSGAHVWNFQDDVVHVRAPFLTIHCSGSGMRNITLPDKFAAYDLQAEGWAALDSPNLRFSALDGSTHTFLVGPKIEIDHILKSDPAELLKIDQLPPRELNVRTNSADFDVPIMRLDEWMETGDGDVVADEWFLRPPRLEEEETTVSEGQAEESDQVGRRRRRRRRRGGGSTGSGEEVTFVAPSSDAEDMGLNVMFRKRE